MATTPSAVGRPPTLTEDERRKRILEAADTVFDQRGYGDATMEEIAQAAGMAKKTVYKHFSDKAALFFALVSNHDEFLNTRISGPLPTEPRAQIRQFLYEVGSFVLAPRQIRLSRLIISEARKAPELAEHFHRECMVNTLTVFLDRLDSSHAIFRMKNYDARTIADMYLGATIGPLHFRTLILPSDQSEILDILNERVEVATELMLRHMRDELHHA